MHRSPLSLPLFCLDVKFSKETKVSKGILQLLRPGHYFYSIFIIFSGPILGTIHIYLVSFTRLPLTFGHKTV